MFTVRRLALAATVLASGGGGAHAQSVHDRTVGAFELFQAECGLVLEDLSAYQSGSTQGAEGELSVEISPDERGIALNKDFDDQYLEVFAYVFDDRVVIECALFLEYGDAVDHAGVVEAFSEHVRAIPDVAYVGGYAPLYDAEYVIGVLGLWPEHDLDTRIRFGPYEAQFFVLRSIGAE